MFFYVIILSFYLVFSVDLVFLLLIILVIFRLTFSYTHTEHNQQRSRPSNFSQYINNLLIR